VVVLMEHLSRSGEHKLVEQCSLPLTGKACVQRVITDLAVIDIGAEGFILRETAPGVTVDDVRVATGAELAVDLVA
jgi:3-oxoacid CoA-transferase subunit B